MIYRRNVNLNPVVKRIETLYGMTYNQCKAVVTLDINDKKGNRQGLVVEYPIQDDKHLCMLMRDKSTKKDINHDEKFPIAAAIMLSIDGA